MSTTTEKKKFSYFYQTYGRTNLLQEWLYDFFFTFSSWPRLVMEVFIRRNMGERYFSLASVITVAVLLAGLPLVQSGGSGSLGEVLKDNFCWYLFLAAFIGFGLKRWQEVLTLPSVFDLERFSMSSGLSFDFLYDLGVSSRMMALVLEPAMAILPGLILVLIDQKMLGVLLLVCGFVYSMSYLAAIARANNNIMDKMDTIICEGELHDAIVKKKDPRQTRGFQFLGTVPEDIETRERVYNSFAAGDAPEVQ